MAVLLLALGGAAGCAPRARPLAGDVVPVPAIPAAAPAPPHELVVFRWRLEDPDFSARGDGAARLARPDSARLDLALEGGFAGGQAWVLGDSVVAPLAIAKRIVPPAALFWGALGRLAVPPGDTAVRRDGDTLRADIVRPDATWRAAWSRDTLRRLERIVGGRVVERVERAADGAITYRQLAQHRALELVVVRRADVAPFDAAIWPR